MADFDWWGKAVRDLSPYWEIDFKNNQVRLSHQPDWRRRLYLRWFKRFLVKELYAWMQSTWSTVQMMTHPTGIKHDDFKISTELEKVVPRGYQMQGGWTIRESDLKYLVRGPLLSQDGQRLLVKAHGSLTGILAAVEKYGNAVRILLGIVTMILAIIFYMIRIGSAD